METLANERLVEITDLKKEIEKLVKKLEHE